MNLDISQKSTHFWCQGEPSARLETGGEVKLLESFVRNLFSINVFLFSLVLYF